MALPAEALDCINCIKSVIEGTGDRAKNAGVSQEDLWVSWESLRGVFRGFRRTKDEKRNRQDGRADVQANQCVTRGQKVQSRSEREFLNYFLQFREEKEKSDNPFPSFKKRKRNLKKDSQLSRRERERDILFSSFKMRKRK